MISGSPLRGVPVQGTGRGRGVCVGGICVCDSCDDGVVFVWDDGVCSGWDDGVCGGGDRIGLSDQIGRAHV